MYNICILLGQCEVLLNETYWNYRYIIELTRHTLSFLFMVELIHCYTIFPVPGQENNNQYSIIVTKMTWFRERISLPNCVGNTAFEFNA